jgi:nucleolar protein 56
LKNFSEESDPTSQRYSKVNIFINGSEAQEDDIKRAQLGLAHQYSRQKCATDVNRQDKPIIQTIALIEQMDKNINTFCMRLREWFSWHFPELSRIVSDNHVFTKLVAHIGIRDNIKDEMKEGLEEILGDEDKAQQILDAAKISMGQDMN